MAEEAQKPSGTVTVLPPEKRGGSRKGVPNKVTRTMREMLIEAANRAGRDIGGEDAVDYLRLQAMLEPKAFMALLGRVVPLQVGVDVTNHTPVVKIERVVIEPGPPPAQTQGDVVPLKRPMRG